MSTDRTVDTITNGRVAISEEYFNELLDSERKLLALENWGVDNWDGYDDAMQEFWAGENDDD
jgi:hypothetical protein